MDNSSLKDSHISDYLR